MKTFNTLDYVHKLKDAGVPEKQAETHAHALCEIIETNLATKTDIAEIRRDIKELEASTKRDIKELEASTKRDIKELELRLENKIEKAKSETLKWIAGMLLAQAAVIASLVKLF